MDENTPKTPASKTGPKPKKLVKAEYEGIAVGRNKIVVDPKEVYKLASIGCKTQEIADWFGVDENTLTYNFSEHILKGKLNLNQSLRKAQISLALSGNATMLIWLGKNILGQSDSPFDSEGNAPLPWDDNND